MIRGFCMMLSVSIIGCGVIAMLAASRGAVHCTRAVHVYVRVDTV